MSCNCVISGRGVAPTEIRQRTRGRGIRVTRYALVVLERRSSDER